MENAIKKSSKLNFCKTAVEPPLSRRMVCLPAAERSAFSADEWFASQPLNGLSPGAALSVCAACGIGFPFRRLSVFPGSFYDVIISIGGHAVNNGVENRKRRKAY